MPPPIASRRLRQADSWVRNLMAPEDKSSWMEAGLGPDDGDLAQRCLAAGLVPADLMIRVDGRQCGERLRGGESVASVWARITE